MIKSMTASYGKLENDRLELGDGLNIITAPNESGKSTWCSFIKNMLYGVDSSAREKGGVKPDKTKYAPWSGRPMEGTMDISCELGDITLSRKGKESAPMRELSVSYTGTGRAAKLSSSVPGEALLGVPRNVFERSAFISQGQIPISSSPELEKRIAAIVQTGDENSSCTDAVDNLRAAMRRRRFNRSGRLPEIEREREALKARLCDMENGVETAERLERARAEAIKRRDDLSRQVSESRKERRKHSMDLLNEAREQTAKAEEAVRSGAEELARRRADAEAVIFAGKDPAEAKKALDEDVHNFNASEGAKAAREAKLSRSLAIAFLFLAIVLALVSLLAELGGPAVYIIESVLTAAGLFFIWREWVLNRKRKENAAQAEEFFQKYNCKSREEAYELLAGYEQALDRLKRAENEANNAQRALSQAKERQGILERSIFRELDFSGGDERDAELTRQLKQADAELHRIREQMSALEGRQKALGTRDIPARLEALDEEYKELNFQYEALSLAADTIKEAGEEIQSRMTPQLSARASELFARLTGGQYDAVALDLQLKAGARPAGDSVDRQSAYLSKGALDQLYLAVRLAICELALPGNESCPLILDDALASFDDERCKLALDLLEELAKDRQIILFTCHNREGEIMSKR